MLAGFEAFFTAISGFLSTFPSCKSNSMNTRSSHLDVAKGIAIIGVVYGHAVVLMMVYPFYRDVAEAQSKFIFAFVMPLFFLVSGAFQRIRLSSSSFNASTYLKKITTSVLLPFYALGLLFLVANVILAERVSAPPVPDMFRALLLEQSNGNALPSVVLWFLFVLFLFHLASFFLLRVFRISGRYLLIAAILLRIFHGFFGGWVFFGVDKITEFFVYYVIGYVFYKRVVDKPISGPFSLLALAVVSIVAFAIQQHDPTGVAASLLKSVGVSELCLPLLTIGVSYVMVSQFKDHPVIKSLAYFGAYSMLVYVFHMPIMTIFRMMATRLGVPPSYPMLYFLFIPGVLLPLLVGKLLAYNKPLYVTLLGRNP
jgi:fucose 4-O-acetylase-like acetyltransferase